MAVPLAFGALLAIWPLGWKRTGRSLEVDEPWPDDLESARDFQITNMAEFHEAREQYRRVTGRIALIKYSPLTADGMGCVFGSPFAADPSLIPPGQREKSIPCVALRCVNDPRLRYPPRCSGAVTETAWMGVTRLGGGAGRQR